MLNQFKTVVLLAFLSTAPLAAWSQNQCVDLFAQRTSVVATATAQDIPVYENTVNGKKLPAILVNEQSYQKLQNSLKKTIGIVVTHQPDYRNDHGMMRLADFFIDRDTPGYRTRGEINQTGIAWASVPQYLSYTKNNGSYIRIEVLFELTDSEYDTAVAYQKMRRAGTIRPDFSFGNDTNPKGVNNRLNSGGEICFSFSCGSTVAAHAREIETQLMQSGVQDLAQFMNSADVQAFLKENKQQLLNSDLTAQSLSPTMNLKNSHAPDVARLMNMDMTSPNLNSLLNWVVGLRLSQEYGTLLNTLNIQNSSSYSNISSPRASAVLVYDGDATAAQFLTPGYTSKGIFSTWSHH